MTARKPKPPTARRLGVRVGDVFVYGCNYVVVVELGATRATCVRVGDGRRTKIQIAALEESYGRPGQRAATTALRKLERTLRDQEDARKEARRDSDARYRAGNGRRRS